MDETGEKPEGRSDLVDELFGSVIEKKEQEKQRREAAKVVRGWLEEMKKDNSFDVKEGARFAFIAEVLSNALRTRGVGFIVKDDPMASRIAARKVEGLFLDAEQKNGGSSTFVIPALQIRTDTTVKELLKDPSGKITLSNLHRMDRTYGEKEGRVSADAAVKVEEEGFGTFPNLDE